MDLPSMLTMSLTIWPFSTSPTLSAKIIPSPNMPQPPFCFLNTNTQISQVFLAMEPLYKLFICLEAVRRLLIDLWLSGLLQEKTQLCDLLKCRLLAHGAEDSASGCIFLHSG